MNRSFAPAFAALVLSACAAAPTPPPATRTTSTTAEKPAASSTEPSAAPAAAVVIAHEVADFKAWKSVFDEHATARKRHNVTQAHVNQSVDNPNLVTVYLAAGSASALQEFAADPDLKNAMMRGGVKGEPTVVAITPTEDRTIKDRALAGVTIRFKVASYETWKSAFDGNASERTKAGIVGYAVNRLAADPSTILVYLQAESVGVLRTFTASPELRATQQRAGVQGPPQISFWQGSAWAQQ